MQSLEKINFKLLTFWEEAAASDSAICKSVRIWISFIYDGSEEMFSRTGQHRIRISTRSCWLLL